MYWASCSASGFKPGAGTVFLTKAKVSQQKFIGLVNPVASWRLLLIIFRYPSERGNPMQLLSRRSKVEALSPADQQEASAAALQINCDADAARLIQIYQFSWRHLELWVAERRSTNIGFDFRRNGGMERLNKAIRVIKEVDVEYVLYNEPKRHYKDDYQRWLVVMMLAKAAGVEEVSNFEDGILHEQFIGQGTISLCHSKNCAWITVTGAGYNPDPDTNPLYRKTIIYTRRTDI